MIKKLLSGALVASVGFYYGLKYNPNFDKVTVSFENNYHKQNQEEVQPEPSPVIEEAKKECLDALVNVLDKFVEEYKRR